MKSKSYRRKNMSVELLDKTRRINKLLHNNNTSKVVFTDICEVMTEILSSNVLVISKKGKVLGVERCRGEPLVDGWSLVAEAEIGRAHV